MNFGLSSKLEMAHLGVLSLFVFVQFFVLFLSFSCLFQSYILLEYLASIGLRFFFLS
jgi:hypothetical protein